VRRRRSAAPAEILKATEELLLRAGIEGVSIRKVSEACGYTAPTIYHHFRDKGGLLEALLEERFAAVYDLMVAIPRGSDPSRHLREMAQAFLEFAIGYPDHYALLTMPRDPERTVPSAEAARELVRADLEALLAEGELATGDVDVAFDVIWAVLHGLISLRLHRPDAEFSPEHADVAFEMLERGLLRRKEASR